MESETARLLELGFEFVGEWRSPECRVHREASIKSRRGIYAFAVNDEVKYVGKKLKSSIGGCVIIATDFSALQARKSLDTATTKLLKQSALIRRFAFMLC